MFLLITGLCLVPGGKQNLAGVHIRWLHGGLCGLQTAASGAKWLFRSSSLSATRNSAPFTESALLVSTSCLTNARAGLKSGFWEPEGELGELLLMGHL